MSLISASIASVVQSRKAGSHTVCRQRHIPFAGSATMQSAMAGRQTAPALPAGLCPHTFRLRTQHKRCCGRNMRVCGHHQGSHRHSRILTQAVAAEVRRCPRSKSYAADQVTLLCASIIPSAALLVFLLTAKAVALTLRHRRASKAETRTPRTQRWWSSAAASGDCLAQHYWPSTA